MRPYSGAISSGSVDEDLIETDDQMDITDEGDEEAEDLSVKPSLTSGSPNGNSMLENITSSPNSMLGLLINKFGFSNIQVGSNFPGC